MASVARAFAAAWLLLIASFTVVAADSRTLHPSATSAQSAAPQAANCVELVANGGFEVAGSGWKPVDGSSLFSYATGTFISGSHSLLLGFAESFNLPATFAVEQSILLPAQSNQIELSFTYTIRLDGAASSGDQAGFVLYEAATNQPVTTVVLPAPANETWSTGRYDLTPLAGREMRLVFVTENDGEPGRLAMYVDDVSVLACQPPPTPLLPPVSAEPTILPPVASPSLSLLPEETPATRQTSPLFPQAATIDSLDGCSCASSLYRCSDFSNWSVAQACYTYCQVTAGFDIHGLDEDRNGIACELELKDVAPLEAAATPEAAPPALDNSAILTPSTALTIEGVIEGTIAPSASLVAEPTAERLTILPPAVATPITLPVATEADVTIVTDTVTTDTITTEAVTATQVVTDTVGVTTTGGVPGASGVTSTEPSTVSSAVTSTGEISPVVLAESAVAPSVSALSATNATAPSPATMLSLLLISPLGLLIMGVLLVVGMLGLALAYWLGQRRAATTK
ncbi:MAG: hypothetical protein IT328_10890 [Caldilineaceae bacterium]|nr:hypothetical protein [Caldilineaceae bacterium]